MDYSFRQFIEQNYMDKLIAAAEEFIECDTRYEIEVTVKCVLIEDIDYSPLKQGKDFVRFPIVLHASTMALDNGESYRREVFLRGMLSGSFSLRFADIDVHCSSASSNYYGRFKRTYTDDLLPITKKDEVEKDAEAFLNCVLRFAECSPALDKNQTFTVSLKIAQEILKKNPKLTKMMMKGRLRFIEHHFVVADPKYVTKDMQLTEYAREHLDECAVKIDLEANYRISALRVFQ